MRFARASFVRDEKGAAAIEFALMAPVLFLLMFAVSEFGMIMVGTNMLESATSNASRLGKTGYTTTAQSRQDMIYGMLKDRAGMVLDPTKVTITSKSYSDISRIGDPEPYTDSNHNGRRDANEAFTDINGNGQWDADMGALGLGGAGDIVVYTVSYPWRIVTPIVNKIIGTNGIYTISSTIVVRNEPYNVGS